MKQLQHLLTKGLQATADLWPPIERAYQFVHQATHILANPEQDVGQSVRARYLAHLVQMQDEIASARGAGQCF